MFFGASGDIVVLRLSIMEVLENATETNVERNKGTFQSNPKSCIVARAMAYAHMDAYGRTCYGQPPYAHVSHVSRERALCLGAHIQACLWAQVNCIFVFGLRPHTAAAGGLPPSLGGSPP